MRNFYLLKIVSILSLFYTFLIDSYICQGYERDCSIDDVGKIISECKNSKRDGMNI